MTAKQQQHLRELYEELRQQPITLLPIEQYRAIPAAGGLISDRALAFEPYNESEMLPISTRLAASFEHDYYPSNKWRAVILPDGTKAAVRHDEAKAFGLEDIGDWRNV